MYSHCMLNRGLQESPIRVGTDGDGATHLAGERATVDMFPYIGILPLPRVFRLHQAEMKAAGRSSPSDGRALAR